MKELVSQEYKIWLESLKNKFRSSQIKASIKVNPQYTSQECSCCGNIDKNNRPKQDKFKCTACGFEINPDIQASQTILKRGLESFGLGTSLVDLNKHKAFRSTSLEVAS